MNDLARPDAGSRIVMLCDNRVIGDSRVIKSARSAAAAGHEVIVLGLGAKTSFTLGGVRVLLRPGIVHVPDPGVIQRAAQSLIGPEHRIARRRTQADARNGRRVARAARLGVGRPRPVRALSDALADGVRLAGKVRRKAQSGRILASRLAARDTADMPVLGPLVRTMRHRRQDAWQHLDPIPQRISDGWADDLDRLQPDLIHAHDYRTLPAAIAARDRAAESGREVVVVYDAHEWVQGYDELGEERHEAAMRIERTLIHRADIAITVDPAIAEMIEASYGLPPMPVVLNAPEEPPGQTPGPRLRDRLRIAADDPLVLYSGSVGKSRALEMCVDALPDLPGVYLALIVGQPDSAVVLDLLEKAEALGVRDRVRVTRYVAQEFVVDFVRDADIGITPNRHNPNTENSLPTKTREYLLAGVPQVVSDVRALSAFIRDHGLGEVFIADDARSFAEAVRTVLQDPQRYRAAITDELREAHSWQTQAAVLLEVYAAALAAGQARERAHRDPVAVEAETHEPVLPSPTQETRLVIGPANSAGQGHAWAVAARSLPGVDAVNVAIDHGSPFEFATDRLISTAERVDDTWVRRFDEEVARTRTHVLLESGSTLSGSSLEPAQVAAHVSALEESGLHVGMILHGSDIRSPRRHAVLHANSPFLRDEPEWVAALQSRSDRTRALVEWLGIPIFVSTLDLLDYVPWATWLPVTVDTARYRSDEPVLERRRPVVLHAPSNHLLKGTQVIEPVLSGLQDEGLIEYRRLVDLDRTATAAAIRTADIVVDQLGMGLYGALACEAMAAGRVVLAEVGATVRSRIPGTEPPIVDITAETLDPVLRRLVGESREEARAAAAAGPGYVAAHHDGTAAAKAISAFLHVPVD